MRLIDADALIDDLEKIGRNLFNDIPLFKIIHNAPTIEAEPVRNGCEHCKDGTYHGQVLILCNDNVTRKIEYCPSCGAKMDGKEKVE